MTHRRIRDGDGKVWEVWEVYPDAVERRISGEHSAGKPDGSPKSERRKEVRLLIPTELQQGWLAFQAGDDRRRLVPVPDNWSSLDSEALLELLRRAKDLTEGDSR